MAGESARESARRQREKAERLQRSAELWERGAEGERATAEVLAQLPAETWTVIHDVRWPGRRFANVDHVVVGPPGVFVIDSKNWSGSIAVRDKVLRQNGRARETAVAGAAEAAIAVAQLTQVVPVDLVVPVLCFVRDEQLTGWSRDVMVCSTANLLTLLRSRPEVLTPEQVRIASLDLDAAFRSAAAAPPPAARRATRVPAQTRARAPKVSKSRRTSVRGDLVKLMIAVALVLVLLTRPELVMNVTGWIAGVLADEMVKTD